MRNMMVLLNIKCFYPFAVNFLLHLMWFMRSIFWNAFPCSSHQSNLHGLVPPGSQFKRRPDFEEQEHRTWNHVFSLIQSKSKTRVGPSSSFPNTRFCLFFLVHKFFIAVNSGWISSAGYDEGNNPHGILGGTCSKSSLTNVTVSLSLPSLWFVLVFMGQRIYFLLFPSSLQSCACI